MKRKRKSFTPAIFLLFFLFFLLSLAFPAVEKVRHLARAGLSPFWKISSSLSHRAYSKNQQKFDQILLENEMLKSQMEGVKEWLLFEERLEKDIENFTQLLTKNSDQLYWQEFFQRRKEEINRILQMQMQAVLAKVIYRDPSSWSSSLWVNVGEESNEYMGRSIICKNSPVVLGKSLIGIVEYVGKKTSRIRLLTDSGLTPSVRAVRGEMQDRVLKDHIDKVIDLIYPREDYSDEEKRQLAQVLSLVKEKLTKNIKSRYLAKGELCGAASSAFRNKNHLLKGRGFNYDYPDEEGPSRHLVSGRIFQEENSKSIEILKKGDLLVTTGYDAIFPAGLHVGIVTKVDPLQEGGSSYSIEAKPTAPSFASLDAVFILPPLNYAIKEL